MDDLAWKMRQAVIVGELVETGRLTESEYERWIADLKQPTTFWGWVSWKVFGL